jgi:hypothetical protein
VGWPLYKPMQLSAEKCVRAARLAESLANT